MKKYYIRQKLSFFKPIISTFTLFDNKGNELGTSEQKDDKSITLTLKNGLEILLTNNDDHILIEQGDKKAKIFPEGRRALIYKYAMPEYYKNYFEFNNNIYNCQVGTKSHLKYKNSEGRVVFKNEISLRDIFLPYIHFQSDDELDDFVVYSLILWYSYWNARFYV